MFLDPNDNTRGYMIGQVEQRGTVIKFAKRNMQIDYKISIKDPTGLAAPVTPMNEILAYKQVNR